MNLYMRYSEYVLYVLYACMRTQLASPAESGISCWVWNDHHLREIMHQPNLRPYIREINIYATLPPLATLFGARKQTNKLTNCNSHSSLLKTLRGKWAGREYYRSLRMAIHINKENLYFQKKSKTTSNPTLNRPPCYHKPMAFVNFVRLSFVSAFVSISATLSSVCM